MATAVGEQKRPPSHRSPRQSALLRWLPTAVGLFIFLSIWLRIRQWWFIPGHGVFGYTEWVARTTIDGTAIAPNQYRPLAPWLAQLFAEGTGLPLPSALVLLDLVMLVALVASLHRLGARAGCPDLVVAAALVWAWWSTKLDHWHPETVLLAALVAFALSALAGPQPRRWPLILVAAAMLGVRTDYAATLGLTVLAVGIAQRCRGTGVSGLVIVASSVAATKWLAEIAYPQASYIVDVVQLPFNLTAGSLAMTATFYGPVLGVIVLAVVYGRSLPPGWPVAVWFVLELGSVFVVGRVEETRIFMPLAPALGAVAFMAYLRLRGAPHGTESGPTASDDASDAQRPARARSAHAAPSRSRQRSVEA